jgi:hypothetical protein
MINRAPLLIVSAFLTAFLSMSSVGAVTVRFDGDHLNNCMAFPEAQEFVTNIVRIVMRASGTLEVNEDITFKPCKSLGRRQVSGQRAVSHSGFSYTSEFTVTRARDWRSDPLQKSSPDSPSVPIPGGGARSELHYLVPPLSPGDELRENIRLVVLPFLFGNQLYAFNLPVVRDSSEYKVLFESERSDVTARLVDPAQFLTPVHDAADRKEWQSDQPKPGSTLMAPRFEITTLGDWTKAAQLLRSAFFMDSDNLSDLETAGIQLTDDPEVLFKRFAGQFGPAITSEFRFEPRTVASISQTGGGDCKSLTFLLLNLLRWSGTEAELVLTSVKQSYFRLTDIFSLAEVDHVLVYVPSLDRYFDPTLGPGEGRQQQLNLTIRDRTRIHVAARPGRDFLPANACADYCILTEPSLLGANSIPVKTVKIPGDQSKSPSSQPR